MPRLIKICGIVDGEAAVAAAAAGADLIGFVFFTKSPRHIAPERAEEIVTQVKWAAEDEGFAPPRFVGLFVDAGEKLMAETAPFLSHFQFHGHEDAERCAEMGAEFGVEVIKAVPVASAADIAAAEGFANAADLILFDARAPKGAQTPGGNGAAFDWSLIAGYGGETPFLLGGGLKAGNVSTAAKAAGAHPAFAGLDVSSGVETAPGRKDAGLIEAFIKAARGAL